MSEPIKVLLVEDNPADVYFIKAGLRQSSLTYDVHHLDDGAEARLLASRLGSHDHPLPHIMLLDLNLPGADGLEILHALRGNPKGSELPVMVVTSSDADQDRQRTAEYGVVGYFRKPADVDEFLRIGEVVEKLITRV
ncbi:MAG TPA: response regulator [Bryobacteraceae bacterium]|nr:response regulator [Bryobacteraceae bacterium]